MGERNKDKCQRLLAAYTAAGFSSSHSEAEPFEDLARRLFDEALAAGAPISALRPLVCEFQVITSGTLIIPFVTPRAIVQAGHGRTLAKELQRIASSIVPWAAADERPDQADQVVQVNQVGQGDLREFIAEVIEVIYDRGYSAMEYISLACHKYPDGVFHYYAERMARKLAVHANEQLWENLARAVSYYSENFLPEFFTAAQLVKLVDKWPMFPADDYLRLIDWLRPRLPEILEAPNAWTIMCLYRVFHTWARDEDCSPIYDQNNSKRFENAAFLVDLGFEINDSCESFSFKMIIREGFIREGREMLPWCANVRRCMARAARVKDEKRLLSLYDRVEELRAAGHPWTFCLLFDNRRNDVDYFRGGFPSVALMHLRWYAAAAPTARILLGEGHELRLDVVRHWVVRYLEVVARRHTTAVEIHDLTSDVIDELRWFVSASAEAKSTAAFERAVLALGHIPLPTPVS